jgi:hypothetical protein
MSSCASARRARCRAAANSVLRLDVAPSISAEEGSVTVVDGNYDDAVRRSALHASERCEQSVRPCRPVPTAPSSATAPSRHAAGGDGRRKHPAWLIAVFAKRGLRWRRRRRRGHACPHRSCRPRRPPRQDTGARSRREGSARRPSFAREWHRVRRFRAADRLGRGVGSRRETCVQDRGTRHLARAQVGCSATAAATGGSAVEQRRAGALAGELASDVKGCLFRLASIRRGRYEWMLGCF